MNRIYLSIFGAGLGHISRTYEIAARLDRDDELLFSTFDEAFQFLKLAGEHVIRAPSIDLVWNEHGGFSGQDTFVRFPLAILSFMRQIGFEASHLRRFKPDLVVSDSRLSTIVAASMNELPVITILNQFKVLFPPRFRLSKVSRFYERIAGDVLGLLWTLSDQVLIPDLPPPYTICEANVSGSEVSNRARFVGFMSPRTVIDDIKLEKTVRALQLDSRPLVFLQISGPALTKSHFSSVALRAVPEIAAKYNVVLSLGIPNGSTEPRRMANGGWVFEWCPLKNELFELSSVLVARAGHSTIGQCIDAGKPAVLVPIYNHSEQIWNAGKFNKLGLGLEVRSEQLTKERLVDSIEQCIEDSAFQENSLKMKEISRNYDGIAGATRIIESYLERSVQKH
ncbi:MAG: hypothetical protein JRN52_08290 [Nitrososphaerota archaeon]|nr:hypothetical protein [Nitrososphaerota archaeon]